MLFYTKIPLHNYIQSDISHASRIMTKQNLFQVPIISANSSIIAPPLIKSIMQL